MEAIKCTNVVKKYGGRLALDHLSTEIPTNSITGIVGRNGAGKTTLLKIIAGLTRETSGDIQVLGAHPFNSLQVSANSIFIDDVLSFPNTLTLLDILKEGERFYPNWQMDLARRLLEYFEMPEQMVHSYLSKGKKSTFNAVFGLATRSPLTIFDEPTTGMDASVRSDFYRALLKDYLAHPRTILISSHHVDEIEDLLEYVLLIDLGKTKLHKEIDDVRSFLIGIYGRTELLEHWVKEREVYYRRRIGDTETYVVIENHVEKEELEKLGFKTEAISCSDACVYVTNQRKGGIDDVFTRR
ncbi:MAG TPA: ABC transporter ATP-binding protein [Bacillota bacterium]|nr:ABC transporter ATP-binding protein [Bacillota bacterium]